MCMRIKEGSCNGRKWYGRMKVRATTLRIAVVMTSLLGLGLAAAMLGGYNPLGSDVAEADHFGIADSVSTSFGYIAIEHAEAISGLSDTDIAGAHAVPGLVAAGTIDVQVGATMTNQTSTVLDYSPEQFELLDANGAVIPLERAPQLPGELQPHAAIDILLDFVTTTEARPFTIRFIDPSTKRALLIDLGDVGCVVQSGNGKPLPVTGGCSQTPDGHGH